MYCTVHRLGIIAVTIWLGVVVAIYSRLGKIVITVYDLVYTVQYSRRKHDLV